MDTAVKRPRRPRRPALTDKMVRALKERSRAYFEPDVEMPSHGIRVQPSGAKAYYVVTRNPYQEQKWVKIGSTIEMSIEESRERARGVLKRVKAGLSAFEPPPMKPESYQATAEKWLELYAAEKGLRTRPETERLLRKLVFPFWGQRDFISIKRRDISELLDHIVRSSGAWNADHVLAIIRKIANWYATRDDDYQSPFVVGMRRTKPQDRERERTLTDKELRLVWKQAEASGTFGALVRILLLTAQRRGAVVRMKSSDIIPVRDLIQRQQIDVRLQDLPSDCEAWVIATEEREKGNAGALQLPKFALDIVKAQCRFSNNPYIFAAARGNGPLNGFNKRKAAFDEACGVTGWTLHDLRRTARSLMSRAGVSEDHAERVLGHRLEGVKKIYNRYEYFKEKGDALQRLANLIERITEGPIDNVVAMHPAAVS